MHFSRHFFSNSKGVPLFLPLASSLITMCDVKTRSNFAHRMFSFAFHVISVGPSTHTNTHSFVENEYGQKTDECFSLLVAAVARHPFSHCPLQRRPFPFVHVKTARFYQQVCVVNFAKFSISIYLQSLFVYPVYIATNIRWRFCE